MTAGNSDKDTFFHQTKCSRCHKPFQRGSCSIRKMSWFNEDTICTICIDEEDELKKALKESGVNVASLEGCGYIPTV